MTVVTYSTLPFISKEYKSHGTVWILWAKKNEQSAPHDGVGKSDGSSVLGLQTLQGIQLWANFVLQ